jgi:hypothetical protein
VDRRAMIPTLSLPVTVTMQIWDSAFFAIVILYH